jgi:hypothetical protein
MKEIPRPSVPAVRRVWPPCTSAGAADARRALIALAFVFVFLVAPSISAGDNPVPLNKFGKSPVTVYKRRPSPSTRWWKGNMHTHSFWSDGDEFPELVAEWYKKRGYNFVVFTPHNSRMRREHDKWLNVETKPGVAARLPHYRQRFGAEWIRDRVYQGRTQVRVRPLAEFREYLEEPNRFLLIAGEEITDTGGAGSLPVHLNVMNLQETILPQGGGTVREVLKRNVDAALAQQKRTGKPLLIQVNHPNYEWAIRAEEIADTRGVRFFEVFNGHPNVHNRGDATHPSTDRIWDLVLARRHERGNREPLYGLAVDDAHKFNTPHGIGAKPGRGWLWSVTGRSQDICGRKLSSRLWSGGIFTPLPVYVWKTSAGRDVSCR